MQTETIDKSQQATPSIDEELIDTLIAISVQVVFLFQLLDRLYA